ncbi:Putative von Willebrand factor, vWF type A domain protein STM2315 [hydrothermal vent metagenome]|uniref:von Willebrand factor, vWF type A domain protein STM2315 n=1 Tax=hydrothermal vent metagenome TaxID=652676 RepID=A0A3B0XC67_9ZZZZ
MYSLSYRLITGFRLALLACVAGVFLVSCGSVETSNTDVAQQSLASEEKTPQIQARPVQTKQVPVKEQAQSVAESELQDMSSLKKVERKIKMRAKMAPTGMLYSPALYMAEVDSVYIEESNRENYHHFSDSPVVSAGENAFSTFSIDVDTGAYSNVRRFLNQGQLPRQDAVRAEELINYFSYDYARPGNKQQPFSINTEIAPTPWNKHSYLLHVGLQAYQSAGAQRTPGNLVFLVDVSGSMQSRDKLQLLKSGLKLLVNQLDKNDAISIVTYAGSTGVVLKPTPGDKKAEIIMALDQLKSGGSTNGAGGIQLAYQMAQQSFKKDGVNRIILATDGDFNVGVTNFEALKQMVEEKRKTGISLTTLGFGRGNYNDHLMEQLADVGNGNYSYIDNLNEAKKVLVDEMRSTLNTVASDVKIQIEFNPQQVAEYRLIGYENRALKREDFNNDKVDAGEIGENHSVTALYEITFTDSVVKRLDNARYSPSDSAVKESGPNNELAFLRLRYKANSRGVSQLIEKPVYRSEVKSSLNQASVDFKFSASVAAFAQHLRGGKYLQNFGYNDILQLAKKSRGEDDSGYRSEFVQLVALAQSLDG